MVHLPSPHSAKSPSGPRPPHYRGYTVTPTLTTLGRTPLDGWSARGRDLYLTTHNTHKRQTSLPQEGFEHSIPQSERPQTHALDRFAPGTIWWYIDPAMYYKNLPLRCNFKIFEFWSFKKQISPKEIIFWHTSELRTKVASEYVIRWSKNEHYPWSTAVLCVKNAWIFILSPPPIHPYGFVSKLSRFPVTVQETAAQRLKTVRLDMAQWPLLLPVIFDPRSCSHRVPLPHHTLSPSWQYDTASNVVRCWMKLDFIWNKRHHSRSNVCGRRKTQWEGITWFRQGVIGLSK